MEKTIHPTKTEALVEMLIIAVGQLNNIVASFKEADFNRIPFEGSWTGAQVTEHVIKSLTLIHQIVNGTTENTSRNQEEHIPYLSAIMQNMEVKTSSAPELIPGNEPHSQSGIRRRLLKCQENLLHDIYQLDLSETCTVMEFPNLGFMTRIEFISFAAFHVERHNRQLQNICSTLTTKNV